MSNDELVISDGRTLRRERNVEAVLDAVHALFLAGEFDPPAEQVAARSGVSLRSIRRYYPDREQLLMASLDRCLEPWEACSRIDDIGRGPLPSRIERFVAQRMRVHEVMAPVARVGLVAAQEMPSLSARISRHRAQVREMVDVHFAPELGALGPERREEVGEAIDLMCQFESVETLRASRGLPAEQVHELLVTALTALLAPRS